MSSDVLFAEWAEGSLSRTPRLLGGESSAARCPLCGHDDGACTHEISGGTIMAETAAQRRAREKKEAAAAAAAEQAGAGDGSGDDTTPEAEADGASQVDGSGDQSGLQAGGDEAGNGELQADASTEGTEPQGEGDGDQKQDDDSEEPKFADGEPLVKTQMAERSDDVFSTSTGGGMPVNDSVTDADRAELRVADMTENVVTVEDRIDERFYEDLGNGQVRFKVDVSEEFYFPDTTRPSHTLLFHKGEVAPVGRISELNARIDAGNLVIDSSTLAYQQGKGDHNADAAKPSVEG